MIGNAANVSRSAMRVVDGGRVPRALVSAAFTHSRVWNMSTFQLK